MDSFAVKALSYGLNKVIAVTANVKESLIKCGLKAEKIEVLNSCFDEKAFHTTFPSTFGQNKEPSNNSRIQTVLFVGNGDKTKGLDLFVAAASKVLQTNPKVKFVVTLHEPEERLKSLTADIYRGLGTSAQVFGVVEDMAKLMASVDIVVAPFRSTEGISDIPIIILEAMALGKPVIASNLRGVREAIQDGKNGIIINLDGPDELTHAISGLLNSSVLSYELGNRASSAVQKFTYSEISKRLSDMYMKIIKEN
jgi:glycosyltransferase involved in cell wall biosynthesis